MSQSFVSTEEARKAEINELLDKLSASKKGLLLRKQKSDFNNMVLTKSLRRKLIQLSNS